ncbi:MAG: hypothetical protein ACREV4_00660 [Gammaproteobacteria bacterium]
MTRFPRYSRIAAGGSASATSIVPGSSLGNPAERVPEIAPDHAPVIATFEI